MEDKNKVMGIFRLPNYSEFLIPLSSVKHLIELFNNIEIVDTQHSNEIKNIEDLDIRDFELKLISTNKVNEARTKLMLEK